MVLELAGEDPLALLPYADASIDRLLATAGALSEETLRGPSLLPGWTRAHVLAHVIGAYESRVRLLAAAREGRTAAQYDSEESRADGIERGAGLPAAELVRDLEAAATALRAAIRLHPPGAWHEPVTWLGAGRQPVHRVMPTLLQETEIHHVDLDAGYTPGDWPEWFARDVLASAAASMRDRAGGPAMRLAVRDTGERYALGGEGGPVVSGGVRDVLAWLVGRTRGDGLTVDPPGPLPEPPEWK